MLQSSPPPSPHPHSVPLSAGGKHFHAWEGEESNTPLSTMVMTYKNLRKSLLKRNNAFSCNLKFSKILEKDKALKSLRDLRSVFSSFGFLLETCTIYRTLGEGESYFFKFSLPLPPSSWTLRH